jgi:primosomal replication protein N
MIKLSNKPLLALICFICSIGAFTSCKKNNDVAASSKIELLSFGPTGAKPGDTLRFIGTNLDKVTSIQFTGTNAIVDQKDFKQQSSDLILVIVPRTTEKGYVTLKTPDGDIVTKTMLNLKVASVENTMTAQARPGDNITITGEYLNWVTNVTFGVNKDVTSFVSQSESQLVVTVPADAQTGVLLLTYKGTDTGAVQTKDTLKVLLPVATSFSPNPVKHNANVTINGTNLDLVKQVLLTGASKPITTFVSQTATQLVVKVDSFTTKGKVTLIPLSGVNSVSVTDLDIVLPTITTMTPAVVAVGSNLTITGTNLDVVKSVSITGVINPVSTFVSQSATQLVLAIPTGSLTGRIILNILNSGLTVRSAVDVSIAGSSVTPIIIYDDAITSAWNGWIGGGWGGTKDLNNTSPVRSGSKSIRIDYTSGGYGVPLQLGGANISLAGYTSLKVSIYGGTGSSGKSVNVGFNEVDGKTITIVEGQWTDFTIPLSQISSASTLSFLYFKNYSASGDFTIYVDNLGIY